MRSRSFILLAAVVAAASRPATGAEPPRSGGAAPSRATDRPCLIAELGAGPLIGLDAPLRGASAGLAVGVAWGPLEAAVRAGAAFDLELDSASMRVDLELGLGGGVRAVAGWIAPLSPPILEPRGAALPLEIASWPSRLGLSARIAELPRGPFGSRVAAEAALIYSAYRVGGDADAAAAALSGAAAFAACLEVDATISLVWGGPRDPP